MCKNVQKVAKIPQLMQKPKNTKNLLRADRRKNTPFSYIIALKHTKKKHQILHFSKKQRFSYYSRSKILIGKNDLNFRPFFSIFQKNTISYLITCFKNPQKTLFFDPKIIEIDLFFSI